MRAGERHLGDLLGRGFSRWLLHGARDIAARRCRADFGGVRHLMAFVEGVAEGDGFLLLCKEGVVYGRLATAVEGKSELLSVEHRVYEGAGYLGF